MSLATFLSKWFRGGCRSSSTVASRRRPRFEALEDRCLPATGPVAFVPAAAAWHIRHDPSAGGATLTPFAFGGPTLTPLAGDWNGDGTDTVGAFDPATATFYLRDANSPGGARAFAYGAPGWLPVVGDWNGDGVDTVGVVDPLTMTWYLRNSNSAGAPDVAAFAYGAPGWVPVVGDWNGDGRDGLGVFDPATATFYLGAAGVSPFAYGAPGWTPVVGDWNGDGAETVGVVSGEGVWYLRNSNAGGAPDVTPFAYGGPGTVPLTMNAGTTTSAAGGALTPGQSSAGQQQQPGSPSAQQAGLTLSLPASVTGTEFTAALALTGGSGFTTFRLDVDLDHDGAFHSPGESGYVEQMPGGTSTSQADLTARGLIYGTYQVRARAFDPATGEVISEVKQIELQRPATSYLPLAFERNQGQTDAQVQFLARSSDFVAFLTGQGLVLSGRAPAVTPGGAAADVVLEMLWGKGGPALQGQAQGQLPGVSNYFIGNNSSQWVTNVANFSGVRYNDAWRNVDVVFGAEGGRLRWDFEVKPGASVAQIQLTLPRLLGSLEVDGQGRLLIHTGGTTLVQAAPVAYQDRADGTRVAVPSRWQVLSSNVVGFEVGAYDATRKLVIDPYIYNTFNGGGGGGANANDSGNGIAVDGSGNAYVVGTSRSSSFPTVGPINNGGSNQGQDDVVVTKLNADGTARIYSTYIGGSNNDRGFAIALDSSNNAYITGDTNSGNFPTTTGVFQTTKGNGDDAFVLKLNAAGNALVYSTFHGGNNDDRGSGIAVDASGNAYVVGETNSTNLPTTTGAFTTTAPGGARDAFVLKVNADATTRVYSTYLGGGGDDRGFAIAIDGSGNAYVTGRTDSNNFPTQGAFQGSRAGQDDAFVTKVNANGTGLVYSSYLGGGGDDRGFGIAIDGSGNAYVTGETNSTGLGTAGVFQVSRQGGGPGGNFDAFVAKIDAAGNARTYFTYLGGNGDDRGNAIAVDASGNAYVAGRTNANNFPTVTPLQSSSFGTDAFVSVLNSGATALTFSTYIGGNGSDSANGIALDSSNIIYVVGTTDSGNSFPNTSGVVQTTNAGGDDMFIAKIQAGPPSGGGGNGSTIAGDVFEANNTSDVATNFGTLTTTQTYNGLTINTVGGLYDQDWYRWTAGRAGTFNVTLTGISATTTAASVSGGTGQIHMRVFRPNADGTLSELGSSRNSGTTQGFSWGANFGDVFYVWVFGYDFSVGTYSMAANVS